MGRKKLPETMETVSTRVSSAMSQEIDAYLAELQAEMPLLNVGRADAVRQLLAFGIEAAAQRRRKRGSASSALRPGG